MIEEVLLCNRLLTSANRKMKSSPFLSRRLLLQKMYVCVVVNGWEKIHVLISFHHWFKTELFKLIKTQFVVQTVTYHLVFMWNNSMNSFCHLMQCTSPGNVIKAVMLMRFTSFFEGRWKNNKTGENQLKSDLTENCPDVFSRTYVTFRHLFACAFYSTLLTSEVLHQTNSMNLQSYILNSRYMSYRCINWWCWRNGHS